MSADDSSVIVEAVVGLSHTFATFLWIPFS